MAIPMDATPDFDVVSVPPVVLVLLVAAGATRPLPIVPGPLEATWRIEPTEPAAYLECRWRSGPEHRASFRFAPEHADSWLAVSYLGQRHQQGDMVGLLIYPDTGERAAAKAALDADDYTTALSLAIGTEVPLDCAPLLTAAHAS